MCSMFMDRIDALARISQEKLGNILDGIPGKKNLVIEPSLMKPLDRFIGASTLRNHGVEKMYKLDNSGGQEPNSAMVYIVRADMLTGKIVCNQINAFLCKNLQVKFHIILVPKLLATIELLIEEEGLCGIVELHSFAWEMIKLDSKVLSFETPKLFRQLFIENDQSLLTSIAKSLWSMQHLFGVPAVSLYHGRHANLVSRLLECWTEECGAPDRCDSDIGCMVVLDRDVDYASVLLMPGTYTGLMSEVLPIVTGTVELKQANKEKKELPVTMRLTSDDDDIYNQIKNRHFSDVNVYLKQKANELITEKNKGAHMSIKEMKTFVEGQLAKLRLESISLSNHFNICEKICTEMGQKFENVHNCQTNILYGDNRKEVLTEIQDMIGTGDGMFLPLRLMCLLSLAQNGFTTEESNTFKKQFLQSYGYRYLSMFHNLEKCALYIEQQSPEEISARIASKVAQVVPFPKKNTFQTVTQKMRLFPDISKTYCLKNPQDPGYVFGGAYIPLVAQIISYIIKKEMTLAELIKVLPANTNGKPETRLLANQTDVTLDINPRCILVYIIGGITFAEIAALQFLEARTGCRILCCGSSIINAKAMLQSSVST